MKVWSDTLWIFVRSIRLYVRTPFIVLMTVIQPILWMFLFGEVFSSMADIPSFGGDSYIEFLGPGIVMMSTMMAGAYAGLGIISDYREGVLDRLLISPIHRSAIVLGGLLQESVTMVIQALLMIGAAFLLGTSFSGGIVGVIQLIIIAVLLGLAMGVLSTSLALLVLKEESLTAAVSFITMPLLFLSGMFVPLDLVPPWIEKFAAFNPLNWAVEAGREVITAQPDWDIVIRYSSYLLLMFSIACVFVLLAFRKYQKTL
ncbi:ABC transporter permease [Virgibacillus proomii]|uniref:ABC transporter permease n=1 Tax=Virgibacillus proomii TaxID=84407 RepID=UPI001C114215|nr:ABC transporter permease [Virgibacillus proomii]MBU5266402.1 ABC transporter permease [Virgibacillus proomii]